MIDKAQGLSPNNWHNKNKISSQGQTQAYRWQVQFVTKNINDDEEYRTPHDLLPCAIKHFMKRKFYMNAIAFTKR